MSTLTQSNRAMSLSTPLGADKLLLERLTGGEAISELFEFTLDTISPSSTPVAFDQVLGQSMTVTVKTTSGSSRYFNGICRSFVEGGELRGPNVDTPMIRYQAVIVPKLWLLTRTKTCRNWQNKSVKDILTEVLGSISPTWKLTGTYNPRDYCVQYGETDFDFFCRLMEEMGWFYFFEHSDGDHTLVIADNSDAHPACPDPSTIVFRRKGDPGPTGGDEAFERLTVWQKTQQLRSGKTTVWDYKFQKTGDNFEAEQPILSSAAAGASTHQLNVAGNDAFELFEYPGGYAKWYDGINSSGGEQSSELGNISQDNTNIVAKVLQETETSDSLRAIGQGRVRSFSSGQKFTLSEHFDASGDWVLVRVDHSASLEGAYTGARGSAPFIYANQVICQPLAVPFRPPKRARKPVIHGPQTATVVGQSGDEIFTDKHGRVKVKFHWDRTTTANEQNSCWLRVATLWAGKGWGSVFLPRVGQEVVVAFLDGDPDRPIVVGSVYNDQQTPPYELDTNKTISGIKTNSTTGGEGFNEIRFQDKAGEEEIYVHGQFNTNIVVENDSNTQVKKNYYMTLGTDPTQDTQKILVQAATHHHIQGDAKRLYDKETHQHTVGNAMEKYDAEKHTHVVGNHLYLVEGDNNLHTKGAHNQQSVGQHSLTCGDAYVLDATGNVTIKSGATIIIEADTIVVKGSTGVSLAVGGNFVSLTSSGVDIKGSMVNINSGGSAASGSAGSATAPTDPTDPTDPEDAPAPTITPEAQTGFKSCSDS